MSVRERFTLTVEREERTSSILALLLRLHNGSGAISEIRCNGSTAGFVAGPVGELVREARVPAREWAGSHPIDLPSETGAHLALLFRAVRPLRRVDRIDTVANGIARMPREEASYWYAKSLQPRGLRALRLLLAGEGRGR